MNPERKYYQLPADRIRQRKEGDNTALNIAPIMLILALIFMYLFLRTITNIIDAGTESGAVEYMRR